MSALASLVGLQGLEPLHGRAKQPGVGAEQHLALLLDVELGGGRVPGSAEVPVLGEGVGPLLALLADVAGRGGQLVDGLLAVVPGAAAGAGQRRGGERDAR